jgi:hypothetical protein
MAALKLPFRARSDPLDIEALNAASELEGDDKAVAEHLIWAGMIDPKLHTVGDLIDHIEGLDAAGRRRLLDRTRQNAGLPTASEIDAVRRMEVATDAARRKAAGIPWRDGDGRIEATCSHPGCTRFE